MNKRVNDSEEFDPSHHRPDLNFWFKVASWCCGVIIVGGGWWMTTVWADTQNSKSDISSLKIGMAVLSQKVDQFNEKEDEMQKDVRSILREVRK